MQFLNKHVLLKSDLHILNIQTTFIILWKTYGKVYATMMHVKVFCSFLGYNQPTGFSLLFGFWMSLHLDTDVNTNFVTFCLKKGNKKPTHYGQRKEKCVLIIKHWQGYVWSYNNKAFINRQRYMQAHKLTMTSRNRNGEKVQSEKWLNIG